MSIGRFLGEVMGAMEPLQRDIKIPLYAHHGVAEVWHVDLQSESVIVHRQPGPEGYRDVSTASSGAVISPLALPGIRLDLAELWRI